ncbi:hypothetical protein EFW59_04236 [Bacillus subtilis]|uniref:hypothetical protein n=1 Tax=Bacillus subtilis TaxID=1423 RepID=UPI000F8DFA68|nr:hypothetical protein [Bacillus subtilis]RUS03639.1 hypothetical protein EFW59_04236 [Bacillus subtilis]
MYRRAESVFSKFNDEKLKSIAVNWLNKGVLYLRSISGYDSLKRKKRKRIEEIRYIVTKSIHNFPNDVFNYNRDSLINDLSWFVYDMAEIENKLITECTDTPLFKSIMCDINNIFQSCEKTREP